MFTFITDNGVFSKTGVDYGSEVLLDAVQKIGVHGSILDMGCGYGTIGVILKKLNPSCSVVSVDVNPRAVELTEINSQQNGCELTAFVSDGFESVKDTFDYVITNPPIRAGKKVIYKMFEDAYDHLDKNGELIAVIRKKQGAESAVKKFEEIFSNCEIVSRDKGYWILRSKKLTG
jgi:16S rRNA (guanine1207-N2)-methyltransferase